MSAQVQQQSHGSRQPSLTRRGEPWGPFLRNFLILQAAFVVLLLIASIDEPLSEYNRAPTATQMAVVASVWVLTDLVAMAVQVVRARAQRAHR
jgi:hypothetical protein